jgi:ABC-type polysaccharide/polyol phosphate transport system ATPase subunit
MKLMKPIIVVENLEKSYQIGSLQSKHNTLRDEIASGLIAPFSQLVHRLKQNGTKAISAPGKPSEIWALRNINLEVHEGEVIGIIGQNGAGKSTLLKILSRITDPTSGRATLYGRVGSLLEVGTGFHPELTGRENIFFNGAILGMSRQEINRKFDEIVAFSEIEKFLDTPVKRYSSGMYTRLAFAVAAHLEPEILLVDEVLAVGDANFQKKCLGKMDDISRQGRTILFVSHNMNAVQHLCPRSILLQNGYIRYDGKTSEAISQYLSSGLYFSQPNEWINLADNRPQELMDIKFLKIKYSSNNSIVGGKIYPEGPFECQVQIYAASSRSIGSIAVTLYDVYGTKLVNADILSKGQVINLHQGINHILFEIKQLYLNPGVYVIGLWVANPAGEVYDHIPSAVKLEVMDFDIEKFSSRIKADGTVPCEFMVKIIE